MREFCDIRPCANHRGIVSEALGGSTSAGSAGCSAPGPVSDSLGTSQRHRLGPVSQQAAARCPRAPLPRDRCVLHLPGLTSTFLYSFPPPQG